MICKKYSAQFKIEKVKEYLDEYNKTKISKAEFALKNDLSDSTFNDWVLKYQRNEKGFCNITNEIIKLSDVEIIDTNQHLIKNCSADDDTKFISNEKYLRLHYNGAIIEFNECILDKVLTIVKKW